MTDIKNFNETLSKNTAHFENELKLYINQKLFDKKIITEDMYLSAKESLIKKAV